MGSDRGSGRREAGMNFVSGLSCRRSLDGRHVLGTWAFRSPAFGERYLLAFTQFAESDPLDAICVEKQVFVLPRANEPKTLVRHLFDRALGHACLPTKIGWREAAQHTIAEKPPSVGPRSLSVAVQIRKRMSYFLLNTAALAPN